MITCVYIAISLAAAFWISHQALKTVYDHEDGLTLAPHDITGVKEIIVNKYKVSMVLGTKIWLELHNGPQICHAAYSRSMVVMNLFC